MELRVLRYFLAVAREESICGAAESLHLSQPTLSRQLMDLEAELGKKLFIRGNRRITLTEDGPPPSRAASPGPFPHFQRGHRRRDGEAGQGSDRLRAAEAFLELLRQEGGDRE